MAGLIRRLVPPKRLREIVWQELGRRSWPAYFLYCWERS